MHFKIWVVFAFILLTCIVCLRSSFTEVKRLFWFTWKHFTYLSLSIYIYMYIYIYILRIYYVYIIHTNAHSIREERIKIFYQLVPKLEFWLMCTKFELGMLIEKIPTIYLIRYAFKRKSYKIGTNTNKYWIQKLNKKCFVNKTYLNI